MGSRALGILKCCCWGHSFHWSCLGLQSFLAIFAPSPPSGYVLVTNSTEVFSVTEPDLLVAQRVIMVTFCSCLWPLQFVQAAFPPPSTGDVVKLSAVDLSLTVVQHILCSQLLPYGHLAITNTPLEQTAAKSPAKTNYRRVTEVNSR